MLQSLQAVTSALSGMLQPQPSGTGQEPDASECDLGTNGSGDNLLFRLFVGWVPKLFTEQDLLPLFEKFGNVRDTIILKDKVTGQPRGCAFVSYATKEEAEAAIAALDKGVHLPGALCPLEVRYARSHQYVQAGSGPEDNRQLFFARVPPSITEEQLRELFAQFGQVLELNLFRERRTHTSKGCGFATMATREQAMAAMEALDERHTLDGSAVPLAVKWADPHLQTKKRQAVEDSNAENRMLFFAKVLRSASEDEVRGLFTRFGGVVEVNLFRAFQGAPTTKGCGLVTMSTNDEAAAAIDALDNKHVWEGMDAPMVVKWMDAALQKRRREEHLAAMRQGLVPSMGSDIWSATSSRSGLTATPLLGPGAGMVQARLLDGGGGGGCGGFDSSSSGHFADVLPAGCAPDAYKLFVGNVPKALTEEDLRPVFESVGPVVELVVVRDKFTHDSKGSAFVWYTNKADADQAVLKFNLQRVLADPSGDQDRPLVVRRANQRKPAALMLGAHAGLGGVTSGAAAAAAAAAAGMSGSGLSSGSNVGPGMGLTRSPAAPGHHADVVPADLQPYVMHHHQQQHQQAQVQAMGMQMQHLQLHHPQQQQQQQYAQQAVLYHHSAPVLQQQSVPMQTNTPMTSNSDNAGSDSYLLQPYGVTVAQASMSGPSIMPLQHQQQQQMQMQSTYFMAPGGQLVSPSGAPGGLTVLQAAGQGAEQSPHQQQQRQLMQQQQHHHHQQQQQQQQAFMASAGRMVAAEPGLGPMVQLSLQVTAQQLSVLNAQMYSIGAMSGADIVTAPAAAGVFHISLTGAQSQVSTARSLITSLLSQAGAM